MTTTAVKERPILFSGPMVRAILADRKTQTRRIIKPQPERRPVPCGYVASGWALEGMPNEQGVKGCSCCEVKCPFPDWLEQLWVRESLHNENGLACYNADGEIVEYTPGTYGSWLWTRDSLPSIHMPRKASRITLEITEVRAERLKDMPYEDAAREGFQDSESLTSLATSQFNTAHRNFSLLWDEINGKGSYDSNPWVWVVNFKRINA